nr:AAA family ATPase [Clostridiales bacterium]
NTVDMINSNPYILCNEAIGIGFERADSIASAMPNKPDDIFRIRAGILYVVTHNLYNGHTCVPRDKLIEPSGELLTASSETINGAIDDLINSRQLIEYEMGGRAFLFLPKIYFAETSAARRIKLLLKFPPAGKSTLEKDIDLIEKKLKIKYAQKQREAIVTAVQRGVLILTGGPGTGKTTILNGILELYEQEGLNIALAAPTGRAAKRMSEVTGREAKTIHRLLEVEWDENEHQSFSRNVSNPIDADALIVDELSMVDIQVFSALLDALPLGCRLVMVGDSDQLPPVGAGNVLHDMIDSGLLPVVELKEVFRQAMESQIVTNAHKIVSGERLDLTKKDSDFFYMERLNSQRAVATITELCTVRLPKAYGYSPISDIQVLCPSRKGELGTRNLNHALQEALNPAQKGKKEVLLNGQVFRVGDKVMQIKNNYDIPWTKGKEESTGIFNGDVGILLDINVASATFKIDFDERIAAYSMEGAKELELAYAITVHKSQGSEFDAVVMPMLNVVPQLSYRNLLYTAVTRAKNIMIIVGDENEVVKMINNDKKTRRFSALKEFLINDGI